MKTVIITIGEVEMRKNHSRRFPYDMEMVGHEIAIVSNYKRELEKKGYTVQIEIYDNLDTCVSGLSTDEIVELYEMPIDWCYFDDDVDRMIMEHVK